MKRDSFILYRSFFEPIKALNDTDKGILFNAICLYALDGIKPEDLPPMVQMAFNFISSTIDRDALKYQNIVKRNRANIGKRWNTKNTTGKSGEISKGDDEDDSEHENDSEEDYSDVKQSEIEKLQNDFYDSLKPYSKSYPATMLRKFYNYWTEPNKSKTKIRWQLEKTWDLNLRLIRWADNDKIPRINNDETQPQRTIVWKSTIPD